MKRFSLQLKLYLILLKDVFLSIIPRLPRSSFPRRRGTREPRKAIETKRLL